LEIQAPKDLEAQMVRMGRKACEDYQEAQVRLDLMVLLDPMEMSAKLDQKDWWALKDPLVRRDFRVLLVFEARLDHAGHLVIRDYREPKELEDSRDWTDCRVQRDPMAQLEFRVTKVLAVPLGLLVPLVRMVLRVMLVFEGLLDQEESMVSKAQEVKRVRLEKKVPLVQQERREILETLAIQDLKENKETLVEQVLKVQQVPKVKSAQLVRLVPMDQLGTAEKMVH
jgi:hypothetical protein